MIGYRDFPRARSCSFCGRIPLFGGSMVVASAGAVCADCLKLMHRITGRSRSWRGGGATPQHLLEELSQKVVGQTHAKRVLAVAGYLHHKRRLGWREEGTDLPKANILLIGPPGSGKTHLVHAFGQALEVPFAALAATGLVQTGYAGEPPSAIGERLVQAANNDVEAARFGVVHLDEIDKLAGRETGSGRDPSGTGVQEVLLHLLESAALPIMSSPHRAVRGRQDSLDTTNVLFLASGSFEGLDRLIATRLTAGSHGGFGADEVWKNPTVLLCQVEPEDLMAYGLLPELVGRFPVILVLDPLDDIALRRILTEPDDAVFRQFQALFAMSGVQLKASEEALVAIAREALHRGVGARGLRAALEDLFLDTMFNLPDLKGVGALHLRGSSYHDLRLVFSTGTQSKREKELHDVGQF